MGTECRSPVLWRRGGGRRPVTLICRYANKSVSFELPDAIDTCVMDYDERRVRCF